MVVGSKNDLELAAGASEASELHSLVTHIADGEEWALSALYVRVADSLQRVARRIVGSRECAEEIVADVFIFVWQSALAFDPSRGTVRAWLHVATRHRAIDRRRSHRRHTLLNECYRDELAGDVPPFQDVTSVHLALSSLSPLRRQLLSMAFFDGLTHEEIARHCGLPLGTVKSHLRRALSAMRHFLEGPARAALTVYSP